MELNVSIHSFVGVMTNSSSELFTCDVDKSVEQVKAILEQVITEQERPVDPGAYKVSESGGYVRITTESGALSKESKRKLSDLLDPERAGYYCISLQ